jgi:hypothetical protein
VYVGPFPEGVGEPEDGNAELDGENEVEGANELDSGAVELKENDEPDVILCEAVLETVQDDCEEDVDVELCDSLELCDVLEVEVVVSVV